jgi:hypothetical protein
MIAPPACGSLPKHPGTGRFGGPLSPDSLMMAHNILERELEQALNAGGLAGVVAQNTAKALNVHFKDEEQTVFPLMSLIPSLPGGRALPEVEDVQMLKYRLEAAMPGLLEDHRIITEAVRDIADASRGGDGGRLARFSDLLQLHTRTEEQIHFPAAILIGETLEAGVAGHLSLRKYYRRL